MTRTEQKIKARCVKNHQLRKLIGDEYFCTYLKMCLNAQDIDATSICNNLALKGHLEGLKFATDLDCPWNAQTLSNAIKSRNHTMVKYLIDHDCPIDEMALKEAFNIQDEELALLALYNNMYWDAEDEEKAIAMKMTRVMKEMKIKSTN